MNQISPSALRIITTVALTILFFAIVWAIVELIYALT